MFMCLCVDMTIIGSGRIPSLGLCLVSNVDPLQQKWDQE